MFQGQRNTVMKMGDRYIKRNLLLVVRFKTTDLLLIKWDKLNKNTIFDPKKPFSTLNFDYKKVSLMC